MAIKLLSVIYIAEVQNEVNICDPLAISVDLFQLGRKYWLTLFWTSASIQLIHGGLETTLSDKLIGHNWMRFLFVAGNAP